MATCDDLLNSLMINIRPKGSDKLPCGNDPISHTYDAYAFFYLLLGVPLLSVKRRVVVTAVDAT